MNQANFNFATSTCGEFINYAEQTGAVACPDSPYFYTAVLAVYAYNRKDLLTPLERAVAAGIVRLRERLKSDSDLSADVEAFKFAPELAAQVVLECRLQAALTHFAGR